MLTKEALDEVMMKYAVIIAESNVDEITDQGVGAILIKDRNIISSGCRHIFKNMCGKEHKCIHAEHMAIMEAGIANCAGATLYVTTEPCSKRWHNSISHHFPPCCELIRKYGIKRVVIGSYDHNFGQGGKKWLEDNSIEVDVCDKFSDRIKAISNHKVHPKVQKEYVEFKRIVNEQSVT
jgi:pyrimidine deaminase RibD-like protein